MHFKVLVTVHCVKYAVGTAGIDDRAECKVCTVCFELCIMHCQVLLTLHCKLGRFADGTLYKVCTVSCEVLLTVHSVKFEQCLVEHALSTVICC